MKETYWNKFLMSGSVVDYLDYTSYDKVQGCEYGSDHARGDEVEIHANARRSNGNSDQGRAHWRI